MADTTQDCILRAHGLCSIQGTGQKRVHCTGLKEDCSFKADGFKIRRQIKAHRVSISSVAAAKISAGHNQTATAIYVGKRGKGKSYAAGSVIEGYANKIAVMLGSNPWDADPEHYFPHRDIPHVGIIDEEDIMRTLDLMREPDSEYGGFILDDVGKFMDARDFMTKKNKIVNKIFQTVRTKHVFTEITIPDDSGLDKDPRENSDFFCIMEASLHDHGLSIGRFFEQNKQYRSGRMWYVYIRDGISPVVRHAFKQPSEQFIREYEPKRTMLADKLFEESMKDLKTLIIKNEDGSATEKEIPKRAHLPVLYKLKGVLGNKISVKQLCDAAEINEREFYRYQNNEFKEHD